MAVAIFAERKLTFVLPQKVQKLLVVVRLQIEQLRDDLVVAARLLQTFADQVANVGSRNLALHVEGIHGGPERFPILDQPLVEIIGNRATPLAPRTMRALMPAS